MRKYITKSDLEKPIRDKHKDRADIETDTAAFLRGGGVIENVATRSNSEIIGSMVLRTYDYKRRPI